MVPIVEPGAVVADKNNQRVFIQPLLLQLAYDLPNRPIQFGEHVAENTPFGFLLNRADVASGTSAADAVRTERKASAYAA